MVRESAGASLVDLGDGVLCLEFHSKMNVLGEDAVRMLRAAIEETGHGFDALAIANQGDHFSAGANLMTLLMAAQDEEWDELDAAVRRFQESNMMLKYAPVPVVAAPFGMALGGGCEVVLHAARVQASAETYMGLVETGVGPRTVSEQQLLDLEREAFLSLCGQKKTQERIQYTLKTGKPLRN